MRNDNKPWKKKMCAVGGRVAKQLGGAIARPIARTLGYKKGDRVYKKGGSAK